MAYPASPVPQYPYKMSVNWKTITSDFDSGKEQRRQKQVFPKYDIELTYEALNIIDFAILWNFYMTCKGSYTAFNFFTLETGSWTGLYIGTGDAVTLIFDIPGKTTSAHAIYLNSVLQGGANYTILTGGGVDSADRIQFVTEPALNDVISCDFTGYMRIRCRFAEDKLGKEVFTAALYKTGIKLKGLTAEL